MIQWSDHIEGMSLLRQRIFDHFANVLLRPALYVEQWEKVSKRCLDSLEEDDVRQILEVNSIQRVRAELDRLQQGSVSNPGLEALSLLNPSLSHLRIFGLFFVESSKYQIDITVLWGMLHLIVQVRVISYYMLVHQLRRLLFQSCRRRLSPVLLDYRGCSRSSAIALSYSMNTARMRPRWNRYLKRPLTPMLS